MSKLNKLMFFIRESLTKKTIIISAKIIITTILLYIIVKKLDIQKSGELFLNVKMYYLMPVLIINNIDRIFMAYKWHILIKAKHLNCPFFYLVRGYYFSAILGNFLPTTVGEDFVRGYSIYGKNISSENVVSSIVIERILGTISLILLVIISLSAYIRYTREYLFEDFLFLLILLLMFLVACFLLSFNKRFSEWVRYKSVSGGKIITILKNIFVSYADYQYHKIILIMFFFLSFIGHCFAIFAIYFITKSLNINIVFISMFYTIPTILIISRIPISIGKLGVQEGAFVALFALIGLSMTEAVTVSILTRIMNIVSLLPVFIFFIFKNYCHHPIKKGLMGQVR